MSTLLSVAIGPVQEFIAAARRTRDLWFGSYLLSEISKAAAKVVSATAGAELVFPAPPTPADLLPDTLFNASNILLVKLADHVDAGALSLQMQEAAVDRWDTLAADALGGLKTEWIVSSRWNQQLKDVVEFYAAWMPVVDGYAKTRSQLMRLMAGRKACRDFPQWSGQFGVPKSSLDGARETVLAELPPPGAGLRARAMKLSAGEQLDAVGLTKRLGGTRRQYPSVSRIAGDAWVRGLPPADRTALLSLCDKVPPPGLVKLDPARFPQYGAFPYEGAAIFEGRLEEDAAEVVENAQSALLNGLRNQLRRLYQNHGEPEPYLAILAADGDGMGRAISKIESVLEHQQFSKALSAFASAAARVVAGHRGTLVYSGGDDVLAFLPVDCAVQCARRLRDEFQHSLSHWKQPPTLSVGIAIGHMMEPLEDLRNYARQAEKVAKQEPKDGLAVALHPRSGAPVVYRGQWAEQADRMLLTWAGHWIHDRIPDKAAYELRALATFYGLCGSAGWVAEAARADALRMLGRKSANDPQALAQLENEVLSSVRGVNDLDRLASAMIVARKIAAVARQAGGVE